MRPLVRTTTCDCLSQWIGDRVRDLQDRAGTVQFCDPHGYQGLTGSKGTFMGSPAAPAFHEVPTRGLRTIGQRTEGSWQGRPGHQGKSLLAPAGPRGEGLSQPPAQHPVSLTNTGQLPPSAGEPAMCALPPGHTNCCWGAWPSLGGGQGRNRHTWDVMGTQGPQPRSKCRLSLGLRRDPS